jgi:cell division septation protein DedD
MTPIQQQRLVGLGLLLLLIGIAAYFLISSANQNHQTVVEKEATQDDNFASLVEPLDNEITEDFLEQEEVLVDPHNLAETETKPIPAAKQALETEEPVKTEEPAPKQAIVEVKKSDKPAILPDKTTELWTAQLASFSLKANAEALAEKVKRQGYNVELLTGKSGNKTIYRVRLQSETNKLSIEKKADSLKKTMNLSPQVFRIND